MYPVDDKGNIKAGSTHDKFLAEMCMKTVINKVCKSIINSSDDSCLKIVRNIGQDEDSMVDYEVKQEIEQNANTEVIDIDCSVDTETGEIINTEQQEENSTPTTSPEAKTQSEKSNSFDPGF